MLENIYAAALAAGTNTEKELKFRQFSSQRVKTQENALVFAFNKNF